MDPSGEERAPRLLEVDLARGDGHGALPLRAQGWSSSSPDLEAAGLPSNARLNRCAMGAEAGTRRFYSHAWGENSSMYRFAGEYGHGQAAPESVPVDTVDAYCERHAIDRVDLMKVDVEGHEMAVLRGAAESLRARRIRCVQFEYNWFAAYSHTFLADYFDLFPPLGYVLFKLFPEGPVRLDGYSHRLESTRSCNYVAALPGVLEDCGVKAPLYV